MRRNPGMWMLVLLALAIGTASAVQDGTSGTLAGRTNLSSALLVNATIVFAGALAAWLVTRRGLVTEPASPWWLDVGGAHGLFLIAGAAFAFPRLGAGPTTALRVRAQLGTAPALDHFGIPAGQIAVTPMRLVGVAFLLIGALLVLWPRLRPQS